MNDQTFRPVAQIHVSPSLPETILNASEAFDEMLLLVDKLLKLAADLTPAMPRESVGALDDQKLQKLPLGLRALAVFEHRQCDVILQVANVLAALRGPTPDVPKIQDDPVTECLLEKLLAGGTKAWSVAVSSVICNVQTIQTGLSEVYNALRPFLPADAEVAKVYETRLNGEIMQAPENTPSLSDLANDDSGYLAFRLHHLRQYIRGGIETMTALNAALTVDFSEFPGADDRAANP